MDDSTALEEVAEGAILGVVSSRRQALAATAACLAYAALLAGLAPWAGAQGPAIPQIVSVFTTGIVLTDLATFFLLLALLEQTADWPITLIACGYLYSALMGAAHLATFPGAILIGRPVIGDLQLTSSIYNEWRLGTAALILCGLALRAAGGRLRLAPPRKARVLLPVAVAFGAALTFALTAAAQGALPTLINGAQFTRFDLDASWAALAFGLAALALAWRWARSELFFLWLALAMTSFCGDLFISNFSGGRYTLGWYFGRASGFVSACTLFLFFLLRFAAQQRLAARAANALRQRTLSLQREAALRAEAEERLVQLQKLEAMGRLTGGIAHDFNNLLAAIVGNLDLLRGAGLGPRPARWVDNALAAAERGRKLTSQLLVFARAQRLEPRPVILSETVAGMRDLLEHTLGSRIRVHCELRVGAAPVLADPTQLELAILNLAVNARDAMPYGGDLTLSADPCRMDQDSELPPGDYVRLTVADTGVGMSADVLARAFDPFFTTKGASKGVGLGLSQVYGFACNAGGTARLESRPGEGVRAHVFLKRAEGRVADPGREAAADFDRLAVSATVLVVDDDADVRAFLMNFLAEIGARALEAADGARGLSLLDEARPDLLIVDFAMPGLNGIDVAKEARARLPDLAVVFVTGYADTQAIETAMGGPTLILNKPFRAADLRAAMREALRRRAS